MPLHSRLAAVLAATMLALPAAADEKADVVAKQKAHAEEMLKKAEAKEVAVVETELLIVVSDAGQAKAKAVADGVQAPFARVLKGLNFEKDDKPWDGKIAIYVVGSIETYRALVRKLEGRSPEGGETSTSVSRSETPFVAVTAKRGDKNPNYDLDALTELAKAAYDRRAGISTPPPWMKAGLVGAVKMRADPKSAAADRKAFKAYVGTYPKGVKMPKALLPGAWDDSLKEQEMSAASVMEYFVYGPGSADIGKLLGGFRPSEEAPKPTFADAAKSAGLTVEGIDKAWREWVARGSVVKP